MAMAWMFGINSLMASCTILCRDIVVLPSKDSATTAMSKLEPHPPEVSITVTSCANNFILIASDTSEALTDIQTSSQEEEQIYGHRLTERNVSLNIRSMQRLQAQLSEGRTMGRGRSFFKHRSILGLPTFDPRWKPYKRWVKVMYVLDVVYTGVLMPILIAYDTQLEWHGANVVDALVGLMFLNDLMLGFHAGYVLQWQGEKYCIVDGWDIAQYYVTQAPFYLNIFFLLPLITQVLLMAVGQTMTEWVLVLVWMRTARTLRIFYIIKQLTVGNLFGSIKTLHRCGISYEKARPAMLLFSGFVLFNMLSCLWIAIANEEGNGPTWLDVVDDGEAPLTNASFPRKYLLAMYFIMTTVLTVGYGDVSAKTDAERLAGIVTMLLGCAYMAYILGSIVDMVASAGKAGRRAAAFHQKAAVLQNFLAMVNPIDDRLEQRLFTYYADVWAREQEEEELLEGVLKELPRALRTEVAFAMVGMDLRSVDAFKNLDDETLKQLVVELQVDFVYEDRVIVAEGEVMDTVFFLQDGEVELSQDLVVLSEVERPCLLGSPNLLTAEGKLSLDAPAMFTLTSVTSCLLWRLPLLRLKPFLGAHPQLAQALRAEFSTAGLNIERTTQDSNSLSSPSTPIASPEKTAFGAPRTSSAPLDWFRAGGRTMSRSRTIRHNAPPPGFHTNPLPTLEEAPDDFHTRALAFDRHRMTFRHRT